MTPTTRYLYHLLSPEIKARLELIPLSQLTILDIEKAVADAQKARAA